MKFAIGADSAGIELKNIIAQHIEQRGFAVEDFGAHGVPAEDYPVYGEAVARAVAGGQCDFGILICGTGIGISLAANKVPGIRAAVCSEPYSARLTRAHNDANILAFGARVVGPELAKMMVDEFIDTPFEGGRHQARVDKITAIEQRR